VLAYGSGAKDLAAAGQFIVRGDKRNFALLRAIDDPSAEGHLRDLVLRAYGARTD